MSKADTTASQNEQIRSHLLSGEKITPIEAFNFYGSLRLGARIFDLRTDPYNLPIQREMVTLKGGKKVARYYLLQSSIKQLKTQ